MNKKVWIMIMVISFAIAVYTTMFWQPPYKNIVENNDESNMVFNSNIDENKNNIDIKNNIENIDNVNSEIYKDNIKNDTENISVENSGGKSIFKVEVSEIEKKLLKYEKESVKQIVDKMSSIDVIKLKEKFDNENKEVGYREAFTLIKLRVSVKDYEEVKEILSKYIDFNVMED
ncbi:MAG: hypothetical protein ACRC68_02595 [Clostridium sp.]